MAAQQKHSPGREWGLAWQNPGTDSVQRGSAGAAGIQRALKRGDERRRMGGQRQSLDDRMRTCIQRHRSQTRQHAAGRAIVGGWVALFGGSGGRLARGSGVGGQLVIRVLMGGPGRLTRGHPAVRTAAGLVGRCRFVQRVFPGVNVLQQSDLRHHHQQRQAPRRHATPRRLRREGRGRWASATM